MSEAKTRPVRFAMIRQAALSPELEKNRAELCDHLDELAAHADFIMPTELSTAPYFGIVRDRSFESWAEESSGSFLGKVARIAERRNATVLIPVYLKCGNGIFANVVVSFGPDGRVIQASRSERETVDYFTKVFPLPGRTISVFVDACNRAGEQSFRYVVTQFIGRSCLMNPAGGMLEQASAGVASALIEIDPDSVRRVPRGLNLLQDRQPYAYDLGARMLVADGQGNMHDNGRV